MLWTPLLPILNVCFGSAYATFHSYTIPTLEDAVRKSPDLSFNQTKFSYWFCCLSNVFAMKVYSSKPWKVINAIDLSPNETSRLSSLGSQRISRIRTSEGSKVTFLISSCSLRRAISPTVKSGFSSSYDLFLAVVSQASKMYVSLVLRFKKYMWPFSRP